MKLEAHLSEEKTKGNKRKKENLQKTKEPVRIDRRPLNSRYHKRAHCRGINFYYLETCAVFKRFQNLITPLLHEACTPRALKEHTGGKL